MASLGQHVVVPTGRATTSPNRAPRWLLGGALAVALTVTVTGAALVAGATLVAGAAPLAPPGHGAPPGYDPTVIGLVLSGQEATLVPPKAATIWPPTGARGKDTNLSQSTCARVIDGGFTGTCAVASGPGGTVVGVVEYEARLEFDLVWARQAGHWYLALRREFERPSHLTHVLIAPMGNGGQAELVFVTPSADSGYGNELDVVGEDGQVALYRFLGHGFVVSPAPDELVTYVPVKHEAAGPKGQYDQMLIGNIDGLWTVVAQQYVPGRAALAQHRGDFSTLGRPLA